VQDLVSLILSKDMFNDAMKDFEVLTSSREPISVRQLHFCILAPTNAAVKRVSVRCSIECEFSPVQIDTEKFPLGQLSKVQVAKGHAVLEVMTLSLRVNLGQFVLYHAAARSHTGTLLTSCAVGS
jgi:hypothetical protein